MKLYSRCCISATRKATASPNFRSHQYHARKAPAPVAPEVVQLLANFASHAPLPISLAKLLSFGRPLTSKSILDSVSYALHEIPRRLATRVRHLEALPFIVGTNPYVATTLNAYRESFQWLATYPRVTNLEQNEAFTAELEHLVESHANDIPTMAKGFQECSRYMSPTQISDFLDGAIRNRISVRLIAEQHIALSRALKSPLEEQNVTHNGIVNMKCSPLDMVRMCGSFVGELCEATLGASPPLVINGHEDATFPYIPVHLEYILTEILKNSFRATVERHYKLHGNSSTYLIPPVLITISPPPRAPGVSGPKFMSMRIRDQGGGVSPTNMARIFSYAFTTAGQGADVGQDESGGGPYAAQHVGGSAAIGSGGTGEGNLFGEITSKGLQMGMGTIAGLGYGLPMSRLYATYFGGSLDLFSLDGWGCDVYLKLRCLDEAGDAQI